jgi:hypothetical protein
MRYEIDHIFVLTDVGAPDAAVLVHLGLTEGRSNRHAGQGTANRRFFFDKQCLNWCGSKARMKRVVCLHSLCGLRIDGKSGRQARARLASVSARVTLRTLCRRFNPSSIGLRSFPRGT